MGADFQAVPSGSGLMKKETGDTEAKTAIIGSHVTDRHLEQGLLYAYMGGMATSWLRALTRRINRGLKYS